MTDNRSKGLQRQPVTDLTQFRAQAMAGTVPEMCELDQSSWDFENLTSFSPKNNALQIYSLGTVQ